VHVANAMTSEKQRSALPRPTLHSAVAGRWSAKCIQKLGLPVRAKTVIYTRHPRSLASLRWVMNCSETHVIATGWSYPKLLRCGSRKGSPQARG
jgi:hypothetical protein